MNVTRMSHNITLANNFDTKLGRTILNLSVIVSDMALIEGKDEQGNPHTMGQVLKQQQFTMAFLPEMDPQELSKALIQFANGLASYDDENPLTEPEGAANAGLNDGFPDFPGGDAA